MDLSVRSTLPEQMDDADLPLAEYRRCLADLARLNRVTLTHRATVRWLARATRHWPVAQPIAILDVACGHGDLLHEIAAWAQSRGLTARLSGIDLNPRATAEATAAADPTLAQPQFHTADVFAYHPAARPDFIVTSQFTHHLADADVVRLLRWMEQTARSGWMIADLHRHWFPYYGFRWLARAAGWHPIVRSDGTISIARAFTTRDWEQLLLAAGLRPGVDAEISWQFPFRISVMRQRPAALTQAGR
jgi:2-polyprenyl-3-methyl-5-hydroxy-6-metoxy-1,4-benzoquinol methylase